MPYKDAEKQRTYKREWKRLRTAGDSGTPSRTLLPSAFRLQTAGDILEELSEQIAEVKGADEAGTLEKARVIGYLLGIALRAVEAGDLAARLEAVEAALKSRPKEKAA